MALVSMRELLDHAAANGYGIPAFNVNNLEQVQAIMEAAKETGAPVIMQASAGARKYAGEGFLKLLIQAAVESYPEIPVVMHQDHGQSPDVCQGAINLGFSSVMMDGSLEADGKTIASYEYNLEVTQKVVSMAHKLGITVEGELGCLGSLETMQGDKEDGHGTDAVMTREQLLTDPEQAADFVAMSLPGTTQARLTMEELEQLLVMHMNWLHGKGLLPDKAVDHRQDDTTRLVVTEESLIAYLLGESDKAGIQIIDDVDLVNVTEAHLAYFEAIGAVGPVADESLS